MVAATMSGNSLDTQEDQLYHPGPIKLLFGAESPIKLTDISRHISAAKKRGRPIEYLGFLGCRFCDGTPKALRALGRKLRRAKIKELAFNDVTGVGNGELVSLAPFLNANSTLRSLDLTGATFDATAIKEVLPFFRLNSSLKNLLLGDNQFVGDEGVKTIVSGMKDNGWARLRVLAIESCGVEQDGASSISDFMCLAAGEHLRILELSDNDIGDAGAEMLAGSIGRGHRIRHLSLNNSAIGDRGALSFGKLLETNRSLKTLSLKNNMDITDAGASGMLKAVYNTESVKTVIESNHVLNFNLRGCIRICPRLLQLATQLCSQNRMSLKDVIRMKISKFMANEERGITLDDFQPELMPRLLAFVGEITTMTSLFHTLQSTPYLYTQYDPEALEANSHDADSADEIEEAPSDTASLGQFELPSGRAREFYSIFEDLEQGSMLHYEDWRIRDQSEFSLSARGSGQRSLSPTGGNITSVVQMNDRDTTTMLKQLLLLCLLHTKISQKILRPFSRAVLINHVQKEKSKSSSRHRIGQK